MTRAKPIDAFTSLIATLTPLSSEERSRVVRAAMAFLGESQNVVDEEPNRIIEEAAVLQPRARAWLKQNAITAEQLNETFHFAEGAAEMIAAHLPGKNRKEQTYNAYVLTGIGQLLVTGNASFDDKAARAACEKFGCYDSANHSAYLRDRGNEFAGSKEKGWVLTAPGLKRAADLIRDINKLNS